MRTPSWARPGSEQPALLHFPDPSGKSNPLRVVIYGDSHVAGFPDRQPFGKYAAAAWQSSGLPVDVSVCGLCGLSANQLLQHAEDIAVLDSMMHSGPGLFELTRSKRGSWQRADLVIILAGSGETENNKYKTQDIAKHVEALHEACWQDGMQTVAMALPDCSPGDPGKAKKSAAKSAASSFAAAAASKSTVDRRRRRRDVNRALAEWARGQGDPSKSSTAQPESLSVAAEESGDIPSLDAYLEALDLAADDEDVAASSSRLRCFLNTGALVPYGPKSRRARWWARDGMHLTPAGAEVLGCRLAEVLRPLLASMQSQHVSESVVDGSKGASGGASAAPSLEAYLEAFRLEDEGGFEVEDGNGTGPMLLQPRDFSWEPEAAIHIQRFIRRRKDPSLTAEATAAATKTAASAPQPPQPSKKTFDGRWLSPDTREYIATIEGDRLIPDEETVVEIRRTGADSFECELMGDFLSARLTDKGELLWEDGETWVREEAA